MFGIAYAAGSLALALLVALVVDATRDRTAAARDPLPLPYAQLLVAIAAIVFTVAGFAHQAPSPTIADNRLTITCLRLTTRVWSVAAEAFRALDASEAACDRLAGAAVNLVTEAVGPLLIVAALARIRRPSFPVAALRTVLALTALYAPIFAFVGLRSATPLGALAYLVGAAFPEEVLYRALLQRRLQAATGSRWGAIVVASVIFGLMHLPINARGFGWGTGLAMCLGTNAFGGLVIGCVYERTGSLLVATALHFVAGMAMGAS